MMNTALVMPVRMNNRMEGFLHSGGCFRVFVLALALCFPLGVHAQWEPDVRLTYDTCASYASWYGNARCIAASGDTLHVVWWDWRDGNGEIYYKRSTDQGLSWGRDTRLSFDTSLSEKPSIAVSGEEVHVVWEDERDGNPEIYYKRSTDGGSTWGTDSRLTADSGLSGDPMIAVSGPDIHLAWDDTRDGNWEIFYKHSSDGGGTWGPDRRLTEGLQSSMWPSVAISGPDIHVAWEDGRDGNDEIYYKHSTTGGITWEPDQRLTYFPGPSMKPSVAVSGSDVHVAWVDNRDSWCDIHYLHSSDRGISWDNYIRLTDNPFESWCPSIAVSGRMVHVVWEDLRDACSEIYYKCSSDGGVAWWPDTRLTYNPSVSTSPSIAVSRSIIHLCWTDDRDGNNEIYYKRNPTGNSGVEVSSGSFQPLTSNLSFSVVPNPFTSFATLLGHEAERFALYDISGRKVGVYKGDRVGEGLRAGVYFLRAESGKGKPMRVVKVR